MIGNLGGMHLLIILGIVLLLFGAAKLPALARGAGQSIKIFRREVNPSMESDTEPNTAIKEPKSADVP